MLTRRSLLATIPISAFARQAAAEGQFAGQTLRIGTFGGTNADAIRAAVADTFTAAGAKLEFVIGSPQDNMAKVIAANGHGDPPMDAFEILGAMVPELLALKLLADLDYTLIPNAQALMPAQRQAKLVAIWTTQEMIICNAAQLAEHGIPLPTSLTDLTDPRLRGRVMIPDISSGGGLESVGAFAMTAGGDEMNIDPGLQLIRRIPDLRLWKAGGEVITAFKSGDIWIAVAHAGWAVRTEYAGVKVVSVPAKLGAHVGLIKEGWIGIVRSSRQPALAAFYINTYLDAATQYQMTVKTGTVPVVSAARARLADVAVVRDQMVLDPARIALMARVDYAKVDLADWNDRWNRIIAH
jgi:putative spermidine/putrescine transport system substrate-binding protein